MSLRSPFHPIMSSEGAIIVVMKKNLRRKGCGVIQKAQPSYISRVTQVNRKVERLNHTHGRVKEYRMTTRHQTVLSPLDNTHFSQPVWRDLQREPTRKNDLKWRQLADSQQRSTELQWRQLADHLQNHLQSVNTRYLYVYETIVLVSSLSLVNKNSRVS